MNETELAPAAEPAADTWEGILANLRRRYPGQKDSVLFCIYKLQQNPELTLRDFAAEAKLHGIPMAGRALHSAKGLLGILPAAPKAAPAAKAAAEAAPAAGRRAVRTAHAARAARHAADDGGSIETKVLAAVRQIQSAAGAEAEQLRTAIRQAVAILQRALGD